MGEFDGETKYRDSGRWSGLPPEEVVIREKDRENWIRALPEVRGFIRWTWRDAVAHGRLARLLLERGVPAASPVDFTQNGRFKPPVLTEIDRSRGAGRGRGRGRGRDGG